MKRSEINRIMLDAKEFMAKKYFLLPPWAFWSVEDWKRGKKTAHEIIGNMLGWDITDFGSGNFYKRGLFLFTLRNGKFNVDRKPYAEKIMIVEEDQETPMHFHWAKMEDIINRGGGNLVIQLYNSTPEAKLGSGTVQFRTDGIMRKVNSGDEVILSPGESICLEQNVYHRFYGEKGSGKVLVGEVSMVNDDNTDNCFYEVVGRFPETTEDEAPLHLLANDYRKFLGE